MKRYFSYILLSMSIFLAACSNEFDLTEDKKEIPVVYCLLDYEAPDQYLRLEKAFASENISAIDLAKNPDSVYYKNAVVKFTRVSKGVRKEFTLQKVDGNTEGYPRKDGLFATSPNVLYKVSSALMPLEPGDVVELSVTTGEGSTVTGQTKIISKVNSSAPSSNGKINFTTNLKDNLKWNKNDITGGALHTLDLYFNYTEVENGKETKKKLYWPIAKNVDKENFLLEPNAFYSYLASNIEKRAGVIRYFEGIDYYIYSGDENLAKFLLVGQANTGITGSGEIPTYTNLSNGLGLLGSKAVVTLIGLDLGPQSREIIKTDPLTKDLNFQ